MTVTVAEVELARFPSKSSMRRTGWVSMASPVRCATGSTTHSSDIAPAAESTTGAESSLNDPEVNLRM